MTSNGIPTRELRSLDNGDLVAKLEGSKEELFNLCFQSTTGQLTGNRRPHTVRRDIARIYIVIRERKLSLSATPIDSDVA